MRIGIHAGSRDVSEIAGQCQRAEVDEVVLGIRAVPGYDGLGALSLEALSGMIAELDADGVKVYGMIAPRLPREMVMGKEPELLERYCQDLTVMGKAGIGPTLFYIFDGFKNYLSEYDYRKPPLEIMPGEPGWHDIMASIRKIVDTAEQGELKLGCHNFALDIIQQVVEEIDSPSLGMTYCTGTYQFGHDPYSLVERFGVERIFLAHARNLVRHGPGRQGHEEVPLDEGDIDMRKFLNILNDAGYDGLIAPEHLGDEGDIIKAVQYLKSIMP